MASEYAMNDDNSHTEAYEAVTQFYGKKPLYHTSNGQDQIIVNAVTGVAYPWRTGTLEAKRLFKIVDTLGTYDSSGKKMKSNALPNSSPNHCYYDSPQQFMNHRKLTVQPAFIQQWEATQELLKEQIVQ
jgi:hypothetical protein